MAIAARFDLAPEKAVEFFRQKGLQDTFDWRDMLHEHHDRAFTVAKMMDLDLLADVKNHVDRAISEGWAFERFRSELTPMLISRGWWGRQEMADPATGEVRDVQLGSARRLRVIYDTNLRTSYAAGHWQRIDDNAERAPYVMYSAVLDDRTRETHRAWNGLVLRHDDEWWKSHTPPNGWNCRCTVIQLTDRDLKRMGKDGPDDAPPSPEREWVNPRTDEPMMLPVGVDPGWGYAPGRSRRESLAHLVGEKLTGSPADLGAAFMASLQPAIIDDIEKNFADFVDTAARQPQPERKLGFLGAMLPREVLYLKERGREIDTAEIYVSDQLLVGVKARRYKRDDVALTAEEWKALPRVLAGERAAYYDTQTGNLVYAFESDADRNARIVVQPDFIVKKKKGEVNMVRSAQKIKQADLAQLVKQGRYVEVKGK